VVSSLSRQPVQTTMHAAAKRVRFVPASVSVELKSRLEDLGKLWLDIVSEYWSDNVSSVTRRCSVDQMFDISKRIWLSGSSTSTSSRFDHTD